MIKLYTIFFCILAIIGANHAKGAIAAWPYSDEHLEKYAQSPEFDASIHFGFGLSSCSGSRVKVSDDDPVDFYITAAHCIPQQPEAFFDKEGVNIVIHPRLDLAVFTRSERSNQPKYPLYTDNLDDLVGKTLTHVGFGKSQVKPENSFKRQAFDTTIGYVKLGSIWNWQIVNRYGSLLS